MAFGGKDSGFKMINLYRLTQPWKLKCHLLWSVEPAFVQVQICLCFPPMGACQSVLPCKATWQVIGHPGREGSLKWASSLETLTMSCLKWSTCRPPDMWNQLMPHPLGNWERWRLGRNREPESCCPRKWCFLPDYDQNATAVQRPRLWGPLVGAQLVPSSIMTVTAWCLGSSRDWHFPNSPLT